MKKIERDFRIGFSFIDWEYRVEISKLKSDIEELEKLGATHVDIRAETDYNDSILNINAFSRREETDNEYEIRINEEQKIKDSFEKQELEYLEKLKSKYEN